MLQGETQADRVFLLLEHEIVSGSIPLGAKLPEEALAERFDVSRGPLREALRRLEGRSLVTRVAHSGVRVVDLKLEDLIELYEVRESLEGLAARLAAERMSEAARVELEDLLGSQQREAASEDDRSYAQGMGDTDFHFKIAVGSRSARLQKLLCEDLYSLIRLCRFRTWTIPGQKRSHTDHERIIEAIRDRDGELAEILMRRHVRTAKARFLAAKEG